MSPFKIFNLRYHENWVFLEVFLQVQYGANILWNGTEYGIIFDTITNDTIIANEFLLLDTILTGID